jgi:quinol monooxygenase YgiN
MVPTWSSTSHPLLSNPRPSRIQIQPYRVSFAGMARPSDAGEVELAIVTMRFDAADEDSLMAVLSKYVVLTRMQPGCRNIDLCASVIQPGRYLIIHKWESVAAQRAHFDSEVMVEMAKSCNGLLTSAPDIDLWDGASAHDLL